MRDSRESAADAPVSAAEYRNAVAKALKLPIETVNTMTLQEVAQRLRTLSVREMKYKDSKEKKKARKAEKKARRKNR